jgi:hypothetical protein
VSWFRVSLDFVSFLGCSASNKVINISGVAYKSTSKKLVKTTEDPKVLVIRGEKFTLDSSGTKLQRDNGHNVRSHLR